jgi:hypothetical protein
LIGKAIIRQPDEPDEGEAAHLFNAVQGNPRLDEPMIRGHELDGGSLTLQLRHEPLVELFELDIHLQEVSMAIPVPPAQGPTVARSHALLPTLEGLQDTWAELRVLLR